MAIAIGSTATASTGSATFVTTPGVTTQVSGSTFWLGGAFGTGKFSSWSDAKGNTYAQIGTTQTSGAGSDGRQDQKINGTGGASHTQTINLSSATYATIFGVEITGADTTAPLDQSGGNVDSTSPYTSPSITTTVTNELLIGFSCEDSSGTIVHTFGNTFTLQREQQDGANFMTGAMGTRLVTSTLTTATSITVTGSVTDSIAFIATYKEAGSGGGPTITYPELERNVRGVCRGVLSHMRH